MECEHRVSVLATGSFGTAPTLALAVEAPGRVDMAALAAMTGAARDLDGGGGGARARAAAGEQEGAEEEDRDLQRREDEARKVFGRILFDAGEGAQRLCAQFRVKSARIRAVCLTKLDGTTAGGLGGIYFSLADAGSPTLAVRGPENTAAFVDAHRRFIPRRWPEVTSVDVNRGSCHQAKYEELDLVDMLMVTLRAEEHAPKNSTYCHWCAVDRARSEADAEADSDDSSEEDDEDSSDEEDEESSEEEQSSDDDSASEASGEDADQGEASATAAATAAATTTDKSTIAYVVRLWQRINYDGKSPRREGPSMLLAIVNCPSESHLGSLEHSIHFKTGKGCGHEPKVVIHLTPKSVASADGYRVWVAARSGARHIFVHDSFCDAKPDPFASSARYNARLREACPQLLPPAASEVAVMTQMKPSEDTTGPSRPVQKLLAPGCEEHIGDQLMSAVHIRVRTMEVCRDDERAHGVLLQRKLLLKAQAAQNGQPQSVTASAAADSNEVCIDDVVMGENLAGDGPPAAVVDGSSDANTVSGALGPETQDASIIFLGTGAAKPAKLRNCSGILVTFANDAGFGLLDVGEGSYSQLVRLFGLERALDVVRRLHWVCVSHAHLDHHGGLGPILEVRSRLTSAELPVYGPGTVGQFLEDLMRIQPGIRVKFSHIRQAQQGLRAFGAQVCDVFHCRDAFAIGLLVPTRDGGAVWLVYSGDTRPCPKMWRALSRPPRGMVARYRVLVHEATFDDSRKDQAVRKRHSTIGEACEAARAMASNVLVLTHFSQRYPRSAATQVDGQMPTIFASDLMRVPLLPALHEVQALARSQQPSV